MHTITVIANDNDFILDMPRDSGHCVPDGSDLVINFALNISRNPRQDHGSCSPWLTSLTRFWLAFPVSFLLPCSSSRQTSPISSKRRRALAQEIGRLGIAGILVPSVRFASSYDGYPGVVGSPGYIDRYWTEPR